MAWIADGGTRGQAESSQTRDHPALCTAFIPSRGKSSGRSARHGQVVCNAATGGVGDAGELAQQSDAALQRAHGLHRRRLPAHVVLLLPIIAVQLLHNDVRPPLPLGTAPAQQGLLVRGRSASGSLARNDMSD